MDMVPNVAEGVEHDFEKDPIQTRIEGDWVYANGTTLGADDGIGISTILAILADKTIQHGPLEALFTVDEEDGMTGAGNLRAEMLSGDIILNLDSEKEGEFCVGCAGSYTILATIPCTMETTPSNTEPYLLKISGLTGGHSGIDIIFERGNAIKILARVLTPLMEEYGVRVANFDGGNARNSIPLFSTANICIPKENVVNCKNYISTAISQIKSQYAETDPSLKVELTPCEMPQNVINAEQVLSTIHSINYAVDGVFRKNEYNDVEISSNLGTLRFENGEIKLLSMVRSMKDEGLHELANILQNNYESFGASVVLYDENPAWQPNYNSPIANKALEIYNRLFSKKGEIHTMHAGLECCYFSIKYPNADIISLGATLENPHTPEERCYIPSVERFYDLVITLLKEIPVKEGQ